MNKLQLPTGVGATPQRARNNSMISMLKNCRNRVAALLFLTSSLFAQDKPHPIAEDVNFSTTSGEQVVLPSDPSPNMVWHKSLDADVSLRHVGTRGEVDEGLYGSVGAHWGTDNYFLSAHYVSNLSPDRPFEGHAIKNEMELRGLFLHQLTPKTQFQWGVWAFTEQPLENTHETSAHAPETHDDHDSHDAHAPKIVEKDIATHDSGHHERLTIIAPAIGLQHKFSDKLRLLFTGSAGFDMTGSPHASSSIEILGTAFETGNFAFVYNLAVNHATGIGTSFEGSTGVVITNRAHTGRFFFVGDVNRNLGTDKTVFGLRTGFSFNLERGHH